MKLRLLIFLGAAAALLMSDPVLVFSQEKTDNPPQGIGIIPAKLSKDAKQSSWFVYELKPGETKSDEVAVINLFAEPVEVKLYPVDATTTKDGVFALKAESEAKEDLGNWVKLNRADLTLPAKSRQAVGFTLTVPDNASPGDHLGGIVAQRVATPSGQGINVVTRSGVRIYLTVPGKIAKILKLAAFSTEPKAGQPIFHLTLRNEGNARVEGFEVGVKLKNAWWPGPVREEITPNSAVLFPDREISLEIPWQGGLDVFGDYDVALSIKYSGGDPLHQSLHFRNFKVKETLVLVGLILGAFIFILVILRRIFGLVFGFFRRSRSGLADAGPAYPRVPAPAEFQAVQKAAGGTEEDLVRAVDRRVTRETRLALDDDLKYEIRRIIREELEMARVSEKIRDGSYPPGKKPANYNQSESPVPPRRLFRSQRKK